MENIIKKIEALEALLLNQRTKFSDKKHLDIKEAAVYLNLSTSTLYKMTSRKELTHYIPGGKKIYFQKSELDDWISAAKVTSVEEVIREVDSYLHRTSKSKK